MNREHITYLDSLRERNYFSRNDFLTAMRRSDQSVSESAGRNALQVLLEGNRIYRVGRNSYRVSGSLKRYRYPYSLQAENISELIETENPYAEYTITELVQLNEFVNHQLAHNIYFLDMEGDAGDFVFDRLKEVYPGRVLLRPDVETMHRYWYNDMIVIGRLISQAPMDKEVRWHARMEKILVDLLTSPLLASAVSESEYPGIFESAFGKYEIDESSLLRYAGRRRARESVLHFIRTETKVRLRTV